jgi:hypothetical protein
MKITPEPMETVNGFEYIKVVVQDDDQAQVLDRFTIFRREKSYKPWAAWTSDTINKETQSRRKEIADKISQEERER